MTATTMPVTFKQSKDLTINTMQMTIEQSMLQHGSILDPLAGNSVVSHLNKSLRLDAKGKIGSNVEKTTRKTSQ